MEIEIEETKRNTRVPTPDRWKIVHYREEGVSAAEVGRLLGLPDSTVKSIYKKYQETGDVKDKPRSGRPLKVTSDVEERIITEVTNHSGLSLTQIIEETKVDISKPTTWRTLKDNGFSCRTSKVKWTLDDKQRKARLAWAKRYIQMPDEYWLRVVFSDESKIQHNSKKESHWVTKEMKVPYLEIDRWQASVTVWGCITAEGVSILEIIDGSLKSSDYLNILRRRLLRNLPALNPSNVHGLGSLPLIFQQDGASIHTTTSVYDYFAKRGIEVLPWPAKSPDLSLIESVWSRLKDKLKRSYETREELVEDIQRCWNNIETEYIANLYQGMKRRIQAIIDSQGGPTDY